jgi:hypothetical protein
MILKWFDTAEAVHFAQELAAFMLSELAVSARKRDAKFAAKAEKVIVRSAHRVQQFQLGLGRPLNFYQKSKLANAFLWALKDGGCPPDYAQELTDWLMTCF